MTTNLPDWLVTEMALRSDKGIVTRSETVAQLHARLRRERGIEWNDASQSWVRARAAQVFAAAIAFDQDAL